MKEIINSRGDDEQLKPGSNDYKIIQSLLDFQPTGKTKAQGMVGIKVNQSPQGGNPLLLHDRRWYLERDDKAWDATTDITTTSQTNAYVTSLGADRVIDYHTQKVER